MRRGFDQSGDRAFRDGLFVFLIFTAKSARRHFPFFPAAATAINCHVDFGPLERMVIHVGLWFQTKYLLDIVEKSLYYFCDW